MTRFDTRAKVLALAFVAALGLLSPNTADAQAIGDSATTVIEHPGDLPFGITVANGDLYVSDLFSGLFYRFTINSLEDPATTLVTPFGPGTYSGLEWHPTEEVLYWVVDSPLDMVAQVLVTSDTEGNFIAPSMELDLSALDLPLDPFVGDFTYNLETDSFWACELANDIYFEFGTDGVATGEFFESPAKLAVGGGAFGVGITAVPTGGAAPVRLDVPVGHPVDLRASRMVRVEGASGAEFGLSYEFDAGNDITGWVTGVAWTDSGSNGGEAEFILDLDNNQIIEIDAANPNARSVTALVCDANTANGVDLSWTNPAVGFSEVRIERRLQTDADDTFEEVASLASTETTYNDESLQNGSYTYRVTAIPFSGTALPGTRCDVAVGPGRRIQSGAHDGENPHGITVLEAFGENSDEAVLVVDLQGDGYLYDKDTLAAAGTITNPFTVGGVTPTTTGVAYNSVSNTIWWYDDDNKLLQETERDGTLIGDAVAVESPFGGAVGDLAFAPDPDPADPLTADSIWAIDLTFRVYFQIFTDGTTGDVLSTLDGSAFDPLGTGIAVTDAPTLTINVPAGSIEAGRVERVVSAVVSGEGANLASEYETAAGTQSGVVFGIAYTATGSEGTRSNYVVANDLNAIVEVSLESGIQPQFIRGACNNDSVVDISDATFLLLFLFGDGQAPACFDGCDIDDNGALGLTDAIGLLEYLFTGGAAPADPQTCGVDPTPETTAGCPADQCEP